MNIPAEQQDHRQRDPEGERTASFDRLFDEAAPLIGQGRYQRASPPVEGGRWPMSVVLRPARVMAEKLEQLMSQVEVYTGPEHFRTGVAGSVHFTVRVLERYREVVERSDELAGRYAEALGRAARRVGPIELDLVGLTLTPGSVMVRALPVNGNAARLMDLLRDELKDDGWREAGFRREIWYANLLHFAADITQPHELITWVAQRRELNLGRAMMDTAELVRFRYENGPSGRLMRPEVLASVQLGSSRQSGTRASTGKPS
jgi:hypothetical protein